MLKLIQTADASMTVGQARESCNNQIEVEETTPQADTVAKSDSTEETPEPILEERLEKDIENRNQPFTLMAHKPNYILLGSHNFAGYNTPFLEKGLGEADLTDTNEVQFQISLKTPIAVNMFNTNVDLYAAYTNKSFWQFYNTEHSSPFRETNHEPELWLQFQPSKEYFGFTNSINTFGINHQSNGRGGNLSRSWNRLFANFVFNRGNFAVGIKPWIRLKEDRENDDNPDITDYMGHFELSTAYKYKENVFSLMLRNNLESGFSRGAVEAGWSFPFLNYKFLRGYIHGFSGYGESLIDYDRRVESVGFGILLTDWL